MTDKMQDLLLSQFNLLPPAVQRIIAESGWQNKIIEIGKKHQLHIDQLDTLGNEVFLSLLGTELLETLHTRIVEHIRVEHTVADELAKEIDSAVFSDIRDQLKKFTAYLEVTNDTGAEEGSRGRSQGALEQKTESATYIKTTPQVEKLEKPEYSSQTTVELTKPVSQTPMIPQSRLPSEPDPYREIVE